MSTSLSRAKQEMSCSSLRCSRAEQSLAADGADSRSLKCLFLPGLKADRAPQVKAIIRLRETIAQGGECLFGLRRGASIPMFSRAWVLLVLLLPCAATRAQETSMVPVIVDGQTVRLEMRIYKPARTGPVPTLVFNHGSTGRGRESRLFKHSIDFPALAQFFVQRGWAVVMPARRGRAGSEGLYNEGFALDRALGYTCNPPQSIPGAD